MKSLNVLGTALATSVMATSATADRISVASNAPVSISVARTTDAVAKSGARVFAVIDFAAGNASIDVDLRPTTLVIFGSPRLGAEALLESQTLALALPLKMLFFEDNMGQTWLTYEDPAAFAAPHGVPADAVAVTKMQAALARFAAIGAGGQ